MEWLFNKKRWQSNIPEIIFLNSDNCVSRHLLKLSDNIFRSLNIMGLKPSWFKIIRSFLPRLKRNGNFCFCNHQAGSIIFSLSIRFDTLSYNVECAFRLMGYLPSPETIVLSLICSLAFCFDSVHILWLLA